MCAISIAVLSKEEPRISEVNSDDEDIEKQRLLPHRSRDEEEASTDDMQDSVTPLTKSDYWMARVHPAFWPLCIACVLCYATVNPYLHILQGKTRTMLLLTTASSAVEPNLSAGRDESAKKLHDAIRWLLMLLSGLFSGYLENRYYPGDPVLAARVMSIPDLISSLGSPFVGLFLDRFGYRALSLPVSSLLISCWSIFL